MVAFNAELHIEEAIKSALDQNYPNIELIVINDGSTDRTLEIVKKHSDSKIRIITQENRGQSAALNCGIRYSSGEYLKFFDADDVMNSEHLMSQYHAIKNAKNCIGSCRWTYFVRYRDGIEFENETTYKDYSNPVDWIYDSITYDKGTMGGWMWLIPRNVLEKAGHWDERLSLNNDFDFSIRILLASSGVRFANNAKLYYRKGIQTALSGNMSKKALESAYLTTCLGRDHLLERENSERIRQMLADRFQDWVYVTYPTHKILAEKCKEIVNELGGSDRKPMGGILFRMLNSFLPWKFVRLVQAFAYKMGWQIILEFKNHKRIKKIARVSHT